MTICVEDVYLPVSLSISFPFFPLSIFMAGVLFSLLKVKNQN